jgi:hypothetical protein
MEKNLRRLAVHLRMVRTLPISPLSDDLMEPTSKEVLLF